MATQSIQASGLLDLLKDTQRDLGEPKFTDLGTDLQDHVALSELMTKNRVSIESGTAVQWNVLTTYGDGAENVGLYNSDNVGVEDGMIQASVDWRQTATSYAIDVREIAINRSPRRIVDLMKQRRIMAMGALAEKFEQNFWKFPAASDNLTPLGLPYWAFKNATEGFNGGIPTGYNDVAGISPTTYPRWKNYTFPFTAISKDDFIKKARTAASKANFKPTVDGIPTFNTGNKYGWYTTLEVSQRLEDSLESQNDDLGMDVDSMNGKVMFRKVPVNWVPYLDADTTNPFYGINWGVFKTYVMRGEWMRQTDIKITPGQHNVMSFHIDCMYAYVCHDRRRLVVGSNGTSYPA